MNDELFSLSLHLLLAKEPQWHRQVPKTPGMAKEVPYGTNAWKSHPTSQVSSKEQGVLPCRNAQVQEYLD